MEFRVLECGHRMCVKCYDKCETQYTLYIWCDVCNRGQDDDETAFAIKHPNEPN